jgi:hypothetical protein
MPVHIETKSLLACLKREALGLIGVGRVRIIQPRLLLNLVLP